MKSKKMSSKLKMDNSGEGNNPSLRNRRCNIKWTTEMLKTLIYLVKKNECLWNTSSKDYSGRDAKRIAWRKIEQQLGVMPEEPLNKWNSLRTAYRTALRKQLREYNSNRPNITPMSETVAALSFLLPVFRRRKKCRLTSVEDMQTEIIISDNSDDESLLSAEDSPPNDDNKDYIELVSDEATRPLKTPVPIEEYHPEEEPQEIIEQEVVAEQPNDTVKRYVDDEFDAVGNFVSYNMRLWSSQPRIVDKFREDLYALIYESQITYNCQNANKRMH